MSKGVGDSAQGFANCILFVFLVPSVRGRYRRAACSCSDKTRPTDNDVNERRYRSAKCDIPTSERTPVDADSFELQTA